MMESSKLLNNAEFPQMEKHMKQNHTETRAWNELYMLFSSLSFFFFKLRLCFDYFTVAVENCMYFRYFEVWRFATLNSNDDGTSKKLNKKKQAECNEFVLGTKWISCEFVRYTESNKKNGIHLYTEHQFKENKCQRWWRQTVTHSVQYIE